MSTSSAQPNFDIPKWFILVVLLLGILVCITRGCRESKIVKQGVTTDSISEKRFLEEQEKWMDKNLKQHLVLEQQIVDAETYRKFAEKEIAVLKLKLKQVQAVTKTITETKIVKEIYWDTVDGVATRNFHFSDPYLTIDIQNDKDLRVELRDTLRNTQYWKRKNIFSEKVYYTDVYNVNPYTQLKLNYMVVQSVKTSKLLVGPSVTIGYDILRNRISPVLGFSVLYTPLTIRI